MKGVDSTLEVSSSVLKANSISDNSLDYVLDFDSIHHSEDFELTFKEIGRVLKPKGVLLCFDRAQPNYTSNEQIQSMLDIEYLISFWYERFSAQVLMKREICKL